MSGSTIAPPASTPSISSAVEAGPGPAPSGSDAAAGDDTGDRGHDGYTVLVLAPTGRDSVLLVDALAAADIRGVVVGSAPELIGLIGEELTRDGAPRLGAVLVADDALGIDWSSRLVDVLDRQLSWSDLPIILLAGTPGIRADVGELVPRGGREVAERLTARGSVTVLDRPVRVAALVSAVRASLRARARQAEVRELIESRGRAQEEAERANRAKSEFLAVLSHELRTPLNAISGHVQLLEMGLLGPVTPDQRATLARVGRAQRHLLGLINDLLNYARLERGHVEYAIEPIRLAEVMTEIGPLIEPQFAAKGVVLDARAPDPDLLVSADREKLRQVLLNLLSNALKFTPAGGHVVVDVVERADGTQPANLVHLRVSDTGLGIPADKLDAIFEPFVQVRADASVVREGTGLGLAISRDLARGMGGDLRARSEIGAGSAFTVTLERAGAAETPAARPMPEDRRHEDRRAANRRTDDQRDSSAGA